jgi:hypothetical protein
MPGIRANRDQHLYDDLITLKRHLMTCRECKAARKAKDATSMCIDGLDLVVSAADKYDLIISMRLEAHKRSDWVVFACPDLALHGKSYPLTAEALCVVGVQGSLL